MKNILLLLILVSFVNINAQENLNPRELDFSDDAILKYINSSSFTPNGLNKNFGKSNFILGWNWGQYITKNLDEAMFINTYHHQSDDPSALFS